MKTSDQHSPLYHELASYSAFPLRITGPTLWDAVNYAPNPSRWTGHTYSRPLNLRNERRGRRFQSVWHTTERHIQRKLPPSPLIKLPVLYSQRASERERLHSIQEPPRAGVGQPRRHCLHGSRPHLVYFVSQNGRGHLQGHVKDLWEDARQIDKVRIHRTSARQYFHTDPAELISLRCVFPARLRGGVGYLLESSGV